MGETSIPCSTETRDRLRDDKTSGVSWNRYLNDLLDAAQRPDESEVERVIGRLDDLEARLPAKVAEELQR